MNHQRLFNAASDCVSRFRSQRFPLKNVAKDVMKARNLNSGERRALVDLVFSFCRDANLVADFLHSQSGFFASMTAQQRDLLALQLIGAKLVGYEGPLLSDYEAYVNSLDDKRYSISLGPLLRSALSK